MRTVLGIGKGLLKALFIGVVLIGTCVMNFSARSSAQSQEIERWGVERKPDTPVRKSRRKYEERNKDERKEKNKVWGTSIDRQYANEIDAFLLRHNFTKVELIVAGYQALMQQVEAKNNRQSPNEQ